MDTAAKGIIPRRAGRRLGPLSYAQERLFLLDRISPGSSAYNVPTLLRVATTLDASRLERCFELIIGRHEILRTAVVLVDGVPMQEVAPPRPFSLAVIDLRDCPDAEQRARAWLSEHVTAPFDLSGDVLLRAALAHVGADEDLLLVVAHHLGSDHASGPLLFDELSEAYAALSGGRPPRLPELAVQYGDFADWQRRELDGERVAELLGYWSEHLGGAPERLELPTDRPRPAAPSEQGGGFEAAVPAGAAESVRALARQHGVSPFTVLLAAFQAVVHRYTGQTDFVLGTPVSGRHHEETARLLGFFSNTLALHADVTGDPSFAELLRRVRGALLGALAHQELPFERLVQELNPARSRDHSPLFQVLFGYDAVTGRERMLAGARAVQEPVPGWKSARFDLSIIVSDAGGGPLLLHVEYRSDLFEEATVRRLVGHFVTLLDAAAAEPRARVSELPLLTDAERGELLEVNATAKPYERACVHDLVAAAAARFPDAVAVLDEGRTVSYRELEARANQLAHELIARGVGPGDRVAVCVQRSAALPIALLAVLRAGAAYVPIDPGHPPRRQGFVLADAGVRALVTELRWLGTVDPGAAAVVCVDGDAAAIARHPVTAPERLGDVEAPAYVIYTSGSTGQPKGVVVAHRSVANLLAAMRRQPGLTAGDVVANLTTPAFDLSVPDWWLPLTTGARLVIVPGEATTDGIALGDWLARARVSFLQATPATWQLLVDAGWPGRRALTAVCGGDVLARGLAQALLERTGSLWHAYGPTETTVWSSLLRLTQEELADGPPPLGGPIANTSFYVVDDRGAPVPVGVPGELLIGGDGVALGYHERPALTAERFVVDAAGDGGRRYRTGDIVRWRAGGRLEFLGRRDDQVKLRGHRIELGEIEAVLAEDPAVIEAAVAVVTFGPGDERLVAYLVGHDGAEVDPEPVRRLLASTLAPYMVPSVFVSLPALPRNPHGKLDRRALPAPEPPARSTAGFTAPETPLQELLVSLWTDVLGHSRVGIDDDFFALGGHSMLAVRMLARVHRELGIAPPLGVIFEHSTIRSLADVVMLELLADTDEEELAGLLAPSP